MHCAEIRSTPGTLYNIPSVVLTSSDSGGVRDYILVLLMDRPGAGCFCGTNLRSCPGGDVNTTLYAAYFFHFMPDYTQH